MNFEPHAYQVFTTNQIIEKKKLALILEMGLGKTVCALTAIQHLMYEAYDVDKVLVIAPLRVADITWPEEVAKWEHLKSMRLVKVIGDAKDRIQALNARADIYVINRENTTWLIDYYLERKIRWPFDTIIIDESSGFKNHQSKRFKSIRKATAVARRVLLLTGTPAPNSLMDLWPQMYLLDRGERLGRNITEYRRRYFDPDKRNRSVIFSYAPKPGAEKAIYKAIEDVAVSLKAQDHLTMPERVDNFIKIRMPKHIEAIYKEMEINYLVQIDEDEITATSAGVVSGKLLQMANGAVYDSDRKVVHIHDLKLDALEEILEVNEGKPILVLYAYEHDLARLMQRFENLKPRELKTAKDKEAWDRGEIRLLLAHPASMGHGLNLQAGGNIIVWFGLTYNLENYLQANARLYRQGQTETVVINHLITEGTEDENALMRLTMKRQSQEELIEAIKAKIRQAKIEKQRRK